MATEKWTPGAVSAWTAIFGTEINSLVNGNAVLSSIAISSNVDMFIELSFIAGAAITTAAPNFLGFYYYPLLHDGSTYADARFGSSAAGPPPGNYWLGNFGFNAAASTTISGGLSRIAIPRGTGKLVLYNQAGATLPSSNVCNYQTTNRIIG